MRSKCITINSAGDELIVVDQLGGLAVANRLADPKVMVTRIQETLRQNIADPVEAIVGVIRSLCEEDA